MAVSHGTHATDTAPDQDNPNQTDPIFGPEEPTAAGDQPDEPREAAVVGRVGEARQPTPAATRPAPVSAEPPNQAGPASDAALTEVQASPETAPTADASPLTDAARQHEPASETAATTAAEPSAPPLP